MAKKKTAQTTKELLAGVHHQLARVTKGYLDAVEEDMTKPEVDYEFEENEDGEMERVKVKRSRKPPTTFLDFTARFLKQNDVTAPPDDRDDLDELDESLARIRQRKRVNEIDMPDINDVKGSA